MGWREDVAAVTAGAPHGPLLNGISGKVFLCACGMKFDVGGVTYRHGSIEPPKIGELPIYVDPTMPPNWIAFVNRTKPEPGR